MTDVPPKTQVVHFTTYNLYHLSSAAALRVCCQEIARMKSACSHRDNSSPSPALGLCPPCNLLPSAHPALTLVMLLRQQRVGMHLVPTTRTHKGDIMCITVGDKGWGRWVWRCRRPPDLHVYKSPIISCFNMQSWQLAATVPGHKKPLSKLQLQLQPTRTATDHPYYQSPAFDTALTNATAALGIHLKQLLKRLRRPSASNLQEG
jgi:hypothetical protein